MDKRGAGDIKTGITTTKTTGDDTYTQFLQNKTTVEQCLRFSSLVFQLSNKWSEIQESKQQLKQEAKNIKDLEQGNENGLLKYLEHLILDNHNYEFMIPYYLTSKEIGSPIEPSISIHENDCFGILGKVSDIID